jgi:hypothetical protein
MKRGISKINAIIILVVSLIILLSIETPLLTKLISKEKDEKCSATAAVHKATKIGIIGDSSPVPIECPRTYVNFYEDHLEIDQKKTPVVVADGNRKTIVDTYKVLNSNIVFPILAERMRVCWKNLGESSGSVFDRNKFTNKNVCVFCAQIKIEGIKTPQQLNLGSAENGPFADYLKSTTMPFSDQKYYSYFISNLKYNPFSFNTELLDAGKTYYIIYHNMMDYKLGGNNFNDEFHISIIEQEQLLANQDLKCDEMYG